jgi:uncharacterized protein with GYD domain
MTLFLMEFTYSSGSWARMIRNKDDRQTAIGILMKAVGGELERIYWDVENGSAVVLAELPDTLVATAVRVAAIQTGAFTQSRIRELLTQSQLADMLLLAGDASKVYRAPGQAAIEDDEGLLG